MGEEESDCGGCVCAVGSLRRAPDGPCLPMGQCQPLLWTPTDGRMRRKVGGCGDNAHYSLCLSNCPATCGDDPDALVVCSKECRGGGCECEAGFVIDKDGSCVLPQDCPPIALVFLITLPKGWGDRQGEEDG